MSSQGRFTFDVTASATVAFSWVEDLAALPQWDKPVRRVTHQPGTPRVGPGAVYLAAAKLGPISMAVRLEVTERDAPRGLTLSATERRMTETTTWTVEPTSEGARVTLHTTHQFHGLLRPLTPLVPVLGRPVQRRALATLAQLIEQRQDRMYPAASAAV